MREKLPGFVAYEEDVQAKKNRKQTWRSGTREISSEVYYSVRNACPYIVFIADVDYIGGTESQLRLNTLL